MTVQPGPGRPEGPWVPVDRFEGSFRNVKVGDLESWREPNYLNGNEKAH